MKTQFNVNAISMYFHPVGFGVNLLLDNLDDREFQRNFCFTKNRERDCWYKSTCLYLYDFYINWGHKLTISCTFTPFSVSSSTFPYLLATFKLVSIFWICISKFLQPHLHFLSEFLQIPCLKGLMSQKLAKHIHNFPTFPKKILKRKVLPLFQLLGRL